MNLRKNLDTTLALCREYVSDCCMEVTLITGIITPIA